MGIVEGQIAAAEGKLSGLYIWGDIAYSEGMLFNPLYWRAAYKPQLKRLCDTAHSHGLKTISRGTSSGTNRGRTSTLTTGSRLTTHRAVRARNCLVNWSKGFRPRGSVLSSAVRSANTTVLSMATTPGFGLGLMELSPGKPVENRFRRVFNRQSHCRS